MPSHLDEVGIVRAPPITNRPNRCFDFVISWSEALVVGSAVTGLLKGMIGRSRPFVSADTNPHDFTAIGIFCGQKVVQYDHQHPDNWIDRTLLHVPIAPDGQGGTAVGWSMNAP